MTIYWTSVAFAAAALLGMAALAGSFSPNGGPSDIVAGLCSGVDVLHLHAFSVPGAILGIGTILNTSNTQAAARWIVRGTSVVVMAPLLLLMWQVHLNLVPELADVTTVAIPGNSLPGGYSADGFSNIGYLLAMTVSLVVNYLYKATPIGLVAVSMFVCSQLVRDRIAGGPWPWQAENANTSDWPYEIGIGAILVLVTVFIMLRSLLTSEDALRHANADAADVASALTDAEVGIDFDREQYLKSLSAVPQIFKS